MSVSHDDSADDATTPGNSSPRGRKGTVRDLRPVFFRLGAVLLALVVGSGLAESAIRLLGLLPNQRAAVTGTSGEPGKEPAKKELSQYVVHPYRAYTPRPGFDTKTTIGWRARVNVFGIRSFFQDPRSLEEKDLVIGIFGGSVAKGLSFRGRTPLRDTILEAHPEIEDSIRIVNFALSGYKQPQQLYLLSEMLLLGVPIDVVVNIDGFNEIALGTTDASRGFHPLYPEYNAWLSILEIAGGTLSRRQVELAYDAMNCRERADSIQNLFHRIPFIGHSALVQAVAGEMILRNKRKAVAYEKALRGESREGRDDGVFKLEPTEEEKNPHYVASLWKRASEEMSGIAESSGATYIHILQPNQYVEGSKELSAEELEKAWNPKRPWSRAAAAGYRELRTFGKDLEAEGIDFHDLSFVFKGHDETIYRDVCCHFNEHGYDVFGRAVGEIIVRSLEENALVSKR